MANFSVHNLVSIQYSVARAGWSLDSEFVDVLEAEAISKVGKMWSRDLKGFLMAYVMAGTTPREEVLSAIQNEAIVKMRRYEANV